MVETSAGKRSMPLLRTSDLSKRAHHGSCYTHIPRREKLESKRGALLQRMQQYQKTTPSHRVGSLFKEIQLRSLNLPQYIISHTQVSPLKADISNKVPKGRNA